MSKHRITKIIKLPEKLFFGINQTTSIFVFESGIPQGNEEIFGCYMESDGLETVKNKGRHDVRGQWPQIEKYWVDSISKLKDDKYHTAQWINPNEHLSYQMPEKPFEIYEEDFRKTAMDYLMFLQGIDAKDFGEKLLNAAMYSSSVRESDGEVSVSFKAGDNDEKD